MEIFVSEAVITIKKRSTLYMKSGFKGLLNKNHKYGNQSQKKKRKYNIY